MQEISMNHWNLVVASYTIVVLCQSVESQNLMTLKNSKKKWLNRTQYFRQRPRWPEQFLKQKYPQYQFEPRILQRNVLPKKSQRKSQPEWPEKVLRNNETKKLRTHIPQTSQAQTIQPYGLPAHFTFKRKKVLISQTPELDSHVPNRRMIHGNIERTTKSLTPEELQRKPAVLHKLHGNPKTKDSMTDTGLGIGGDFSYERRSFDTADADFVSFLMAQADEMAEAMMELFATRRVPQHFSVHHTRCLGVNSYCREVCFQVEADVCNRFKCSRQVKEYLTKQCENCNLRVIRNFPKKLLMSLDFLKAREVYSKNTNRSFESFYTPKNLRPYDSKDQPGQPRPVDFSYYTNTSNNYYTYYSSEESATNATMEGRGDWVQ